MLAIDVLYYVSAVLINSRSVSFDKLLCQFPVILFCVSIYQFPVLAFFFFDFRPSSCHPTMNEKNRSIGLKGHENAYIRDRRVFQRRSCILNTD